LVDYFHPSSNENEYENNENKENNEKEKEKEKIVKLSLELFYYWVNFAPLTRGTSATGYASFLSFVILLDDYTLGR
jgi:hypothetical protein